LDDALTLRKGEIPAKVVGSNPIRSTIILISLKVGLKK